MSPAQACPGGTTMHRERFTVHGVELSLSTPADAEEATAAAQAVRRLATETAARWAGVPGTLGTAALRARVLDEAGALLDELGLVHWALGHDGDVLCSGSAHPRRSPAEHEAVTPFFGTPWSGAVEGPDGVRLADVGLAGTPGWPAALLVRHRGEGEHARLVAVLASSAREAEALAHSLLEHPVGHEAAEAALTVRGAAALISTRDALTISSLWPAAGEAWSPKR